MDPPKLDDLVFELKEVVNDWHQLGTYLRVPSHKLKEIDNNFHDSTRKLNEMFQRWLLSGTKSWTEVIEALEKTNDHQNLCSKLREKCYHNVTPSVPSQLQSGYCVMYVQYCF